MKNLIALVLLLAAVEVKAAFTPGALLDTYFSNRFSIMNSNMTRWLDEDGAGRYRTVKRTNLVSYSNFFVNHWIDQALSSDGIGFCFNIVLSNKTTGVMWHRARAKGVYFKDIPWNNDSVTNLYFKDEQ